MGRLSKFWGSIIGGAVGAGVGVLASYGLASCTTEGVVESCAVLGFSTTQITSALTLLGSAVFTYFFPPNAA